MYTNFVPSSDENHSSIQPKNVTHVLWRTINTAEQFKTGGVTDKKITIGKSSTAPLEALRLFTDLCTGVRDVNPNSVSVSPQDKFHLIHKSVLKPRSCWPDETSAQNKNSSKKSRWRCLASVLSSFQNCLKHRQKIAEDMKIYNAQLVMGLVYRSTLQVYIPTMAWYREIHVWVPSWLASCVICCKKKTTWPVYFITVRTKSRRDRVKEALKTQLINIRQSQTTRLLLHNCPIK